MKIIFYLLLIMSSLAFPAMGQTKFELPVWPNGPAESNGITAKEFIKNHHSVFNISKAVITVQLPAADKANGAAVLICPGGGYIEEAIYHEGYEFADWLNEHGIAGIVLKYRLPNGHSTIPLSDAKEAMRIIRAHATEWHIDPNKVAVAGFSAGGHLASTLGTHYDVGDSTATNPLMRYSTRPDLMLLFYPVITMKQGETHLGSRENLLGKHPTEQLVEKYSNELHVTKNTPPAVLMLSDDDHTVPQSNSIHFYEALHAHHVPASLYIFPSGGHGWGMNTTISFWKDWRALLLNWLEERHFIPANTQK
ncbi:alpha/beta hydrolase [Microbacter margulisiae]|uniref:Acetyl esterase/lipase n=1 Tax=Microbacter margulisiae TaxID=1350067 RepID=A0A7W5DRW3_9PORP|nr:alpha/beta hydrolase [Microbacter margulisiae]MBB3187078.1 acetyl esterase/lipase [Microbacter margulisiae]